MAALPSPRVRAPLQDGGALLLPPLPRHFRPAPRWRRGHPRPPGTAPLPDPAMAEEAARRAVAAVPLLRTAAGPRDRERWAERLKEEYRALIQVRRSRRPFVSRKFPSFHHLFRLSPFFFPLHFSLFPPYRRFFHSFSSPFPILALFPPFFFPFCFPLAHFSCFSLLLFPIFPSFAPISPFSFPVAFPPLFPLLTFPPPSPPAVRGAQQGL